ncbi:MAG TPA: TRAP transporter substrate-binding protein, partial [Vicinamibacterales bacterium]|nr:TRAP transporter substrate-binding protein [Vicinamibacterales bacterium]
MRAIQTIGLLGVCSAAALAGCAGQRDGITLRLGHDQPSGHPYDLAASRFARTVEEASAGRIQVAVYPAAQLGDSPEQIEGLHLGSLDLALAAFSHASQFCAELGLFGAPYLFEDERHFAAVFDGEIGDELDRACGRRYGLRLLSTLTSGDRVFFNSRRAVERSADLAGLKVRVMGGEADALTWQAFGAIPVPMPYSEVYSALQAGVIDGAENEPVSIVSNRFYETARHIAPTRHLVLPMGLFISDRTLDRLPEGDRTIVRERAREIAVWQRALMTERNAAALAEMQQRYGIRVSPLDATDLRGKARPVQDRVAARLGVQSLLA